ncbi:hypothetical protein BU25DRAFT_483392 [Macroventuria anomochaeta]|uniref:Uncharacterized protein n=1 Tax=Macroventuria anomochaeta TaxID=301207 RepID=A0ACB6S9C9_9PLEO|nr:uncharacterized protein BU25DRAFT_483392 [Macroventuria anomochaeta]KAF2630648.1 hypothetical protein BU25DRAFT_483392 [Macroventuria anomochaeta]
MADGPGAFAGIDMDALFAASPAQQKQMLGEALWPKIYDIQPELAGKISDILLEMDSSELINLVFDESALRAEADGTMRVYDEYLKDKDGGREKDAPKPLSTTKPRLPPSFPIAYPCSFPDVDCEFGGGACKINAEFNLEETDTRTAENRVNLEVFKRKKRHDSLDGMWTSLKADANHARRHGVKRNAVAEELVNEVTFLARREEELAQRRTTASSTIGCLKAVVEFAELERGFAADQLRLIQRTANVSAHIWKAGCERNLHKDLCKFQSRNADKHEIKFWLMNLLVSSSRNDPWGCKTSLEAEEVQTVIDLVDNLELQEECSQKIEDAKIDDDSPEEFAYLEDLESSLEDEKRAYISQLAATLFKYNGDVQARNVHMGQEEVNEEVLSTVQQALVTNVMEAMNSRDRSLATSLLQQSAWVADAALARWFERETSNPSPPLSGSSGKRLYVAEAEPGRSKRQRTGTPDPEETLEAARARLDRILAKDRSAEQDRAEQSQQEMRKSAEASSETSKPTVQGKSSLAPGSYSLEVLNKMITNDANAQAKALQEKENTKPSDEIRPDNRRSSLRTRSQKINYKVLHNGIGPLKQVKQRTIGVEANRGSQNEQQRTQLPPDPASAPSMVNTPGDLLAALSEDTVSVTPDIRISVSSRQGMEAPADREMPQMPPVYANPLGFIEANGVQQHTNIPNILSPALYISSSPSDSSSERDFASPSEISAVLRPFGHRVNEVVSSSPDTEVVDEGVGMREEALVDGAANRTSEAQGRIDEEDEADNEDNGSRYTKKTCCRKQFLIIAHQRCPSDFHSDSELIGVRSNRVRENTQMYVRCASGPAPSSLPLQPYVAPQC